MIKRLWLILIFLAVVCASGTPILSATHLGVPAQTIETLAEPLNSQPIQIDLLVEDESIQPGRPFWVAVRLKLKDNYHAYWKNPGDAGFPTTIQWHLPSGFEVGPMEWPAPSRFEVGSSTAYGYGDEAWLLVPITPPKNLSDKNIPIKADIKWLVCSDETCLPGDSTVELLVPVSAEAPKKDAALEASFTQARAKLPKKEWSISAEKKKDGIAITLTSLKDQKTNLTHAYFCEEETCAIDHKQKNPLKKSEGVNGEEYSLFLKTASPEEFKGTQWLKGVLVLYNEQDSSHEAIDVDSMLANLPNDFVASGSALRSEIDSAVSLAQPASQHEWQGGVALAILFAFIGGMILNLMPCVLPVISFKVLSFVKMAGQSRSLTFKHGLIFSLGVLVSFWTLAGALLALQSYGRLVGWGFQLQEPIFVGGLAAVLMIFSLSLFGVFELGTLFASWAGQAAQKPTSPQQSSSSSSGQLFGSFCSGVLATAVATPCTGPFLGSALGFAVTLSPLPAMMIFTSLGLGMAFPYLLLAAFPSLLRFMPKPGNWMVAFKELMGFFMLATVLWLVWVFGGQTDEMSTMILLVGFLFMSIGCWIYGKWGSPINKKMTRMISYGCAALFLVLGSAAVIKASTSDPVQRQQVEAQADWEPYSAERIAELQKKGIPVLVDFTAKWCLICQANHLVLISPEVSQRLDQLGVVRMKADWTRNDEEITKALREFGRSGVPLYVVYGADADTKPHILPQVLTSDIVLDHLDKVDQQIASRK